jgi:hypothetical protein
MTGHDIHGIIVRGRIPGAMKWRVEVSRDYGETWEPVPLRTDIVNHSPTGHAWGYAGSGPSQTALDILLLFMVPSFALELYQEFKGKFVANLAKDEEWEIGGGAIMGIIVSLRPPKELTDQLAELLKAREVRP